MIKTITINLDSCNYEIVYSYIYDPGIRTYPNGDPGYPPVIDLDIISVLYKNVDIIEVVKSTTSLLSKIEDAVLQKEGH